MSRVESKDSGGIPREAPMGLGNCRCYHLRCHWCHCGYTGKEQRQVVLGGKGRCTQPVPGRVKQGLQACTLRTMHSESQGPKQHGSPEPT